MRLVWVLMLLLLAAPPAHAQAMGPKGLEVCVKTALKQLMLFKSVVSQRDIRDRTGKVTGQQIVMKVNALGKEAQVNCIYDGVKGVALIEPSRPGSTAPGVPGGSAREALTACQRAAQAQSLMLDGVVSESDIRNTKGQVVGRTVVLNVFQAGRPSQVVCSYDYASKQTALELRRPQFR